MLDHKGEDKGGGGTQKNVMEEKNQDLFNEWTIECEEGIGFHKNASRFTTTAYDVSE